MSTIEKIFIGAMGGFSAVLVKFLGQDWAFFVNNAGHSDLVQSLMIGYLVLSPILMFLGSFVAWISDEKKRMKLAALAIAAPAMITTWSGGNKSDVPLAGGNDPVIHGSWDFFISSAYAQVPGAPHPEEKNTVEQIKDGVGMFFGFGKETKHYYVVVGSYKDRNAAQQFADKINSSDNTLKAWVADRVPPNDYYPVIVGSYLNQRDANALKERALGNPHINNAYLSPGIRR